MAKKKADLASFKVKSATPMPVPAPKPEINEVKTGAETDLSRAERELTLKRKTFEIHPDAIREFEILRAARGLKSYELVAEALNLLFEKHGRPQVA